MNPFRYTYLFSVRQELGSTRKTLDCFLKVDMEELTKAAAIAALEGVAMSPLEQELSRSVSGMQMRARLNSLIGVCRVDSDDDMDGDSFEQLIARMSVKKLRSLVTRI